MARWDCDWEFGGPSLTFPSVTGSVPFLNLATVILQLVESEESTLASLREFTLCRFAVTTPTRWLVIHGMQASWSVSSPEEGRELPCPLL